MKVGCSSLPCLLVLLVEGCKALQCYTCDGPAPTWTLAEREKLSTLYERGERFSRGRDPSVHCLSTGGRSGGCTGAEYCTLELLVGTQNYVFTPGHGDMSELQVTGRGCSEGPPDSEYHSQYPPPGAGQTYTLASDWKTRHIKYPEGMTCKLIQKVEEERLHCICKGDFCNEDIIPGNGHNFFNFSAKITYVVFGLFSVAFLAICFVCAVRRF